MSNLMLDDEPLFARRFRTPRSKDEWQADTLRRLLARIPESRRKGSRFSPKPTLSCWLSDQGVLEAGMDHGSVSVSRSRGRRARLAGGDLGFAVRRPATAGAADVVLRYYIRGVGFSLAAPVRG
jgi:hypothetical protein